MSQYRGFDQNSDSGRNYSTGAWGSGNLDAEALAAKYGLDRSNPQTSKGASADGHLWGRDAGGKDIYIGQVNMDLAGNKDLIAAHSRQANPEEGDHSALGENLSSFGDIKGALLTEWAGGGGAQQAAPEVPPPVVLSDRAAEAVAGTKTYEDVFLPRQGDYTIKNDQSVISDFNDQYRLNLARAKAPQPQDGSAPIEEAPAKTQQQKQAAQYANDYKKAVGDTLAPAPQFQLNL